MIIYHFCLRTKMSTQDDQGERNGTWLRSTAAMREYFLCITDLDLLEHQCLQEEQTRRGRPVKIWNSEDLKQAAVEKYGKEEFQAKFDSRAQWRQKRNFPIYNYSGKASAKIKYTKTKRRRRTVKNKADDDSDDEDDNKSNVELEELCVCIKKCKKEQLEQIISLMAQTDASYLRLFNKIKLVSLLPRSKFQIANPELAKLLSTAEDENNSGHSVCKEDNEEEGRDDEEEASNMALEGSWTLTIVAPQWRKGEEGSLDIIFFGSGFSVNGDICFPTSCIFGDIVGFKTNSSMEETSICFETRSEMKDQWYTGALQVFISRDEKGLHVSGSFWPGFKEQDLTNTVQFTGRKAESYCS